MNRRSFMKKSALGATLGMNIPLLSNEMNHLTVSPLTMEGKTIVFQGDSITDAGRDKEQQSPNSSSGLGRGYASLAVAQLLAGQAKRNKLRTMYSLN